MNGINGIYKHLCKKIHFIVSINVFRHFHCGNSENSFHREWQIKVPFCSFNIIQTKVKHTPSIMNAFNSELLNVRSNERCVKAHNYMMYYNISKLNVSVCCFFIIHWKEIQNEFRCNYGFLFSYQIDMSLNLLN